MYMYICIYRERDSIYEYIYIYIHTFVYVRVNSIYVNMSPRTLRATILPLLTALHASY